jgi:hypothetical protein
MNEEQPEKQEITRDEKGHFVGGVSGNPKGRPVFSLITLLKAELQKCPEGQDKKTYADMLIQRIMKKAISDGDDQQIKNILQYVEGMPKQKLELDGEINIALVEFINEPNKDTNTE